MSNIAFQKWQLLCSVGILRPGVERWKKPLPPALACAVPKPDHCESGAVTPQSNPMHKPSLLRRLQPPLSNDTLPMRRAWYRDKGGSRAAESVPAGEEEEGGGGGAERGSEQPVGDLARLRSGEDRDQRRIESRKG